MTGTEEEVFRQQVEAIREQGGTAWLALLNNLQAPGPGHAQVSWCLLQSLTSQTMWPHDGVPVLRDL